MDFSPYADAAGIRASECVSSPPVGVLHQYHGVCACVACQVCRGGQWISLVVLVALLATIAFGSGWFMMFESVSASTWRMHFWWLVVRSCGAGGVWYVLRYVMLVVYFDRTVKFCQPPPACCWSCGSWIARRAGLLLARHPLGPLPRGFTFIPSST